MQLRTLSLMALAAVLLGGCNLIYKQNIQQGNALEQEDLDELYIGMNQRQVLFVLGTPSIRDPFQPNRWDYVQTFSRRGGEMVQRTVTLRFEDDLLAEIEGQQDPFGASEEAGSARPGQMATFVKKPQQQPADPHDASLQSAEEEVMGSDPDIDAVRQPSAEERDYDRERDVLDQTPNDGGPMGPDIDG